jgi:hypothetical protein
MAEQSQDILAGWEFDLERDRESFCYRIGIGDQFTATDAKGLLALCERQAGEIERLRGALEKLAGIGALDGHDSFSRKLAMVKISRAALEVPK